MSQDDDSNLKEVKARVETSHRITDLTHKLDFYDHWAATYDQLQARGYKRLHGVDGSPGMLAQARAHCLYQNLQLCTVGRESLPSPEGTYDAVLIVGALSEGQVPYSAIPELLRVTKPGGLLCLTTRTNPSNLSYKISMEAMLDMLEQAGAWERLMSRPVEQWELATSESEAASDPSASPASPSFISGIVYLYRRSQRPIQAQFQRPWPQPRAAAEKPHH
ncbi:methyltransferase-like protein 27 isoform X2 [Sorex araneus]|uniref:methyltransferase-like protein 27 isoform X2 n=1 Tax=Sorex araneus TaxID=42254 RepID=UPI0024339830|nr:methyltransferase-like protein 27 isoform X2 [Sorex araneus]XP_054992236.1 methyltransferase-like protein 27 isoform X2 [Sorex araneus]